MSKTVTPPGVKSKPVTTPPPAAPKAVAIVEQLKLLQAENAKLKDQAARALADYQNLVRRQQADQANISAYAKAGIFSGLLQPLEHLALAAISVNDPGLNMVIKQFWEELATQGLQEFRPLKEKFNPETMEATEKAGPGDQVLEVFSPGYLLDGKPLKVARVKVG